MKCLDEAATDYLSLPLGGFIIPPPSRSSLPLPLPLPPHVPHFLSPSPLTFLTSSSSPPPPSRSSSSPPPPSRSSLPLPLSPHVPHFLFLSPSPLTFLTSSPPPPSRSSLPLPLPPHVPHFLSPSPLTFLTSSPPPPPPFHPLQHCCVTWLTWTEHSHTRWQRLLSTDGCVRPRLYSCISPSCDGDLPPQREWVCCSAVWWRSRVV